MQYCVVPFRSNLASTNHKACGVVSLIISNCGHVLLQLHCRDLDQSIGSSPFTFFSLLWVRLCVWGGVTYPNNKNKNKMSSLLQKHKAAHEECRVVYGHLFP